MQTIEAEISSTSLSDDQTGELKDVLYIHVHNAVSSMSLISSYVHWCDDSLHQSSSYLVRMLPHRGVASRASEITSIVSSLKHLTSYGTYLFHTYDDRPKLAHTDG